MSTFDSTAQLLFAAKLGEVLPAYIAIPPLIRQYADDPNSLNVSNFRAGLRRLLAHLDELQVIVDANAGKICTNVELGNLATRIATGQHVPPTLAVVKPKREDSPT